MQNSEQNALKKKEKKSGPKVQWKLLTADGRDRFSNNTL